MSTPHVLQASRRSYGRRSLSVLGVTAAALLSGIGGATASANHYDRLLAPTSSCPGQSNLAASIDTQKASMRCMHNYARTKAGRRRLAASTKLNSSAGSKARDLVRCGVFSHTACGRSWSYWLNRVGYTAGCWGAGENIAWGSSYLGSVRRMMSMWLHSDGHRANILKARYRDLGLGLVQGTFQGYAGAQVWVAHFGYRC